jgi:hypothetical protein
MLCELCLTCKTYFYVLPQEQVARHVARRFASSGRKDNDKVMKLHGAIRKPARRGHEAGCAAVGRRVSVPQEVFGFHDDDGIFFDGTVIQAMDRRCLVRFDYTGDEEWFALALTRRWLRAEVHIDPLCALLQTL